MSSKRLARSAERNIDFRQNDIERHARRRVTRTSRSARVTGIPFFSAVRTASRSSVPGHHAELQPHPLLIRGEEKVHDQGGELLFPDDLLDVERLPSIPLGERFIPLLVELDGDVIGFLALDDLAHEVGRAQGHVGSSHEDEFAPVDAEHVHLIRRVLVMRFDLGGHWHYRLFRSYPDLHSPCQTRLMKRSFVRGSATGTNGASHNRSVIPDLQGLAMSAANLSGADLSHASLSGAMLIRARLVGADLRYADLRGAQLHEADLTDADLYRANLEGAALPGAKLRRTRLEGANLRSAVVTVVDFRSADLRAADFTRADLRESLGVGATLERAKLDGAELFGCRLNGVNLRGATGVSARQLEEAILDELTSLPDGFAASGAEFIFQTPEIRQTPEVRRKQ